jgi:hypothetical protein
MDSLLVHVYEPEGLFTTASRHQFSPGLLQEAA